MMIKFPRQKGRIIMYHYIFFDLDGTLTDSKEGILNCLRYAFEKLGEPAPPESTGVRLRMSPRATAASESSSGRSPL